MMKLVWPAAQYLIAVSLLDLHSYRRSPWQKPPRARDVECVSFTTPRRLEAGRSFSRSIGHGLAARLTWDGTASWDIAVGKTGTAGDYLWVVSPPFQTAPHRQIGPGYNLTARQSARLSPRTFRFVMSQRKYEDAKQLVERAQRDSVGNMTIAEIEQRGEGSLQLRITGFGLASSGDALTWVRVTGRACQPR